MFKKASIIFFTLITLSGLSTLVWELVDKVSDTPETAVSETAITACVGISAVTLVAVTALLVVLNIKTEAKRY